MKFDLNYRNDLKKPMNVVSSTDNLKAEETSLKKIERLSKVSDLVSQYKFKGVSKLYKTPVKYHKQKTDHRATVRSPVINKNYAHVKSKIFDTSLKKSIPNKWESKKTTQVRNSTGRRNRSQRNASPMNKTLREKFLKGLQQVDAKDILHDNDLETKRSFHRNDLPQKDISKPKPSTLTSNLSKNRKSKPINGKKLELDKVIWSEGIGKTYSSAQKSK